TLGRQTLRGHRLHAQCRGESGRGSGSVGDGPPVCSDRQLRARLPARHGDESGCDCVYVDGGPAQGAGGGGASRAFASTAAAAKAGGDGIKNRINVITAPPGGGP